MFRTRKIKDLKSVESSKAFCMKPFVHLFVSHYGSVVPCCLTPWDKDQALGDINSESVQAIWNGERMREFRAKMLRDQADSRCKQCYESERNGQKSTRKMTNALYSHKMDWVKSTKKNGYSPDSKPIFWDIRVSNLCNFKCRICGHHSSSQWYNDAKALNLIAHDVKLHRGPKDFDLLLKQLEFVLPDLEEIYFAGGEPLILEEHFELINLLIEKGLTHIKLRYATNFSQLIFKGSDLFERWAKFNTVIVMASLDDSGKRGEYQRSGQNWQEVVENRKRMLEICPNIDFLITPTISIFNIFSIGDFHKECVETGLCELDQFMPHTLRGPKHLSINILPKALKQDARKKIEMHVEWILSYAKEHPLKAPTPYELEQFGDISGKVNIPHETGHLKLDMVINEFRSSLAYMDFSDCSDQLPAFLSETIALDELRNESFFDIAPEYLSLKPSEI